MEYFIEEKKVSKKEAEKYVNKLWGNGTFEKREQEAKEYFYEECDTVCSWADGFSIHND